MPASGRVTARLLDPLVAGATAMVVYSLHGFSNSLDRDPATFIYGGQQFAAGTPPYRGIFNSVGPLGDMTAGIGILLGRLADLDDVTGARLIYLTLSAACVAVLSVLARESLGSRAAGVLAPAVFLTFSGFVDYATAGPREKTVMVLCLELSLLLLLRRRWFGAGVLTALATLTWQPVVLPLAGAAAVAILTSGTVRRRAAAGYLAGALVPTVLMVGYFAVESTLTMAWWGFVRVNVGYTRQPTILDSGRSLPNGYGWSLVLVVLGCVGAMALGARSVVRTRAARTMREAERTLLVVGGGALPAVGWTCYAINGPGDLFVVLPFAALGVAAVLIELASRLSATAARGLCAAVVVAAVVGGCVAAITTRDHDLQAERRNVTRMLAAVPPGSSVLTFYAPEVPVLAHRSNPDPWQLSDEAKAAFFDDHLPGGLTGYAARISRTRPTLIVIGRRSTTDWLRPVLDRSYARVGRGQHWTWYASKTLGRPTLQHLRDVNRQTARR